MYNQWSLNKTESISLTYGAVRQQRIRCFDWAIAEEFLSDFLNLFRAPGELAGGGTTFIYRAHPSKPNDTLMAVYYCFLLAKIFFPETPFFGLYLKLRPGATLCSPIPWDLSRAFSGLSF